MNLITQKNSQSGAHFVHEGEKNGPFVSAWRWPQIGTRASYVFDQTKASNRGSPGPTLLGPVLPSFLEAGALWLGETGSYDMIQTDVMNHSDTETTHCQNACSSYLWAQRPPPPQVQYSSLLFFCCCCLKAIIFHGCHLKFFNFKILAKKSRRLLAHVCQEIENTDSFKAASFHRAQVQVELPGWPCHPLPTAGRIFLSFVISVTTSKAPPVCISPVPGAVLELAICSIVPSAVAAGYQEQVDINHC